MPSDEKDNVIDFRDVLAKRGVKINDKLALNAISKDKNTASVFSYLLNNCRNHIGEGMSGEIYAFRYEDAKRSLSIQPIEIDKALQKIIETGIMYEIADEPEIEEYDCDRIFSFSPQE